jgi:chorismate mutase/prephenate dehydratase
VLYSHPQVFAQCRHWLLTHLPGIPLVETASTADAAARCLREPTAGALAGTMAAEHFGVPIQVPNIEDFGDNITRFLILGHRDAPPTGDDKTSVLFVVRDRVGALYDCLRPFEECGVSMTMIESRPSRRRNWDYHFFVDFLGHVQDPGVVDVLEQLSEHCQTMKVLGSYPRGLQPHVRGRNGESDGIRPADR